MPAPTAEPPPAAAAELRGVSKRFGSALALENLSLVARPGEFLTLLGPSGCGKTTCLRLLSGLEQPDTGAVFLAGRDVTALPPHRREVNQVFQAYALFPHLTVRDNIAFGLRMKRLAPPEIADRLRHVVELTALAGLLDRRPAQLSGGQRQRVALARALVCAPAVLLLDEPLSALDARLRIHVRAELRALQRRLGLTFILVTHDQEEALALSDRVAVMAAGRVEQIGSPEEVYHRPASRFVAEFIGEANLLPARLTARAGDTWVCHLAPPATGEPPQTATAPLVLRVAATADPGPPRVVGDTVNVLVRPERVRVLDRPAPGWAADTPNIFPAVVDECRFQGAASLLVLRVHCAENPGAEWPLRGWYSGQERVSYPRGTPVWVTIDPADAILLS